MSVASTVSNHKDLVMKEETKTPALWDFYTLLCGWTGVGRAMTSNNDIKYGSFIGAMGKTSQGKWDRECWGVEVEGYRFS